MFSPIPRIGNGNDDISSEKHFWKFKNQYRWNYSFLSMYLNSISWPSPVNRTSLPHFNLKRNGTRSYASDFFLYETAPLKPYLIFDSFSNLTFRARLCTSVTERCSIMIHKIYIFNFLRPLGPEYKFFFFLFRRHIWRFRHSRFCSIPNSTLRTL